MTGQQILQSDPLDLLFENRNKAYGAYSLRKGYPTELWKAVGATGLLVLLLLFVGGNEPAARQAETAADGYRLTQAVLTPEPKKELPRAKPQPPAAPRVVKQTQFTNQLKLVNQATTAVATQDELLHTQIGTTTVDGPPAVSATPPVLPPSTGGGEAVLTEPDNTAAAVPNRQPQFPGGTEAWLRFLGKYLRAPQELGAGERRTVLVRFAVDEEGVVTRFAVVQTGGAEFDNEVIRVLKKMPRWLPAIQNGKPVSVSFTQPVTFAAAEE